METDAFFYQLFHRLPQTMFELLGLPAKQAQQYRFDSVELKKAFRIDGLFLPRKRGLPLYFTEVQFQRSRKFYANLFAKVFCYLEENDPMQEWVAVAIFPTRKEEATPLGPYEDFVALRRVRRVYLEDIAKAADPSAGLAVLQLMFASAKQAEVLAPQIVGQCRQEAGANELQANVIELVERLLLLRFPEYDREAMRMKFKLHDIKESKVWQEANAEGVQEGICSERQDTVRKCLAKGMTEKQIGDLLEISVQEVRKLANGHLR